MAKVKASSFIYENQKNLTSDRITKEGKLW